MRLPRGLMKPLVEMNCGVFKAWMILETRLGFHGVLSPSINVTYHDVQAYPETTQGDLEIHLKVRCGYPFSTMWTDYKRRLNACTVGRAWQMCSCLSVEYIY